MPKISWLAVSRAAAAIGFLFAAWIAGDSVASGMGRPGAADEIEFFLLWGLPFAVAAVFLGWYAARGNRSAARSAARSGCGWALLMGGGVFLALLASPLLLSWDALRGAVTAFLYAPLAATAGLAIGLIRARSRNRG